MGGEFFCKKCVLFRQELFHMQREFLKERTRCRALEEELENPMNVHRWRKLEVTSGGAFLSPPHLFFYPTWLPTSSTMRSMVSFNAMQIVRVNVRLNQMSTEFLEPDDSLGFHLKYLGQNPFYLKKTQQKL